MGDLMALFYLINFLLDRRSICLQVLIDSLLVIH
jgi:hypothetical protein